MLRLCRFPMVKLSIVLQSTCGRAGRRCVVCPFAVTPHGPMAQIRQTSERPASEPGNQRQRRLDMKSEGEVASVEPTTLGDDSVDDAEAKPRKIEIELRNTRNMTQALGECARRTRPGQVREQRSMRRRIQRLSELTLCVAVSQARLACVACCRTQNVQPATSLTQHCCGTASHEFRQFPRFRNLPALRSRRGMSLRLPRLCLLMRVSFFSSVCTDAGHLCAVEGSPSLAVSGPTAAHRPVSRARSWVLWTCPSNQLCASIQVCWRADGHAWPACPAGWPSMPIQADTSSPAKCVHCSGPEREA